MVTQPNFITVEEYLVSEERSDTRHEYWNGHMVAMAGGSPTHADIIRNLMIAIGGKLREIAPFQTKRCRLIDRVIKVVPVYVDGDRFGRRPRLLLGTF